MHTNADAVKHSRWAQKILAAQGPDGLWGDFHSLAVPTRATLTTEQALLRLQNLGYTIQDKAIHKTVQTMDACLRGKREMPDKQDKLLDWDVFSDLMLATWIRRFTPQVESANTVAGLWAAILTAAFAGGAYNHREYLRAYKGIYGKAPSGARLTDFVCFYQVSLLANELDEETERLMLHHVLHYPNGLYYVYDSPNGTASLSLPPAQFASRAASRYLAAIQELAAYQRQTGALQFAAAWLLANKKDNGWDFGPAAKDGVYLPLGDSWHTKPLRVADCTYRVQRVLGMLAH